MRKARQILFALLVGSFALSGMAADNSMFNYQARVLVQGIPYTGTGQVKIAILANPGGAFVTLWSNDGSSVAGSEPTGSFSVSVTGGVFDTMIGDTELGMQAIPAVIFNRNDELRVRVWFNDGVHGFQQLSPDRRLTNPRRLGTDEIHTSTTLYVNAATGDDLYNGLSPASAKKTIQAAVDMAPRHLSNNLTIVIASGIYREKVTISDVVADPGFSFLLLGDKTTVPSETVSPNVRITGTDNDSTHLKVRSHAVYVSSSHNVALAGLLLDYSSSCAYTAQEAVVLVDRCKASYSPQGFQVLNRSNVFTKCWATYNDMGYGVDEGGIGLVNSGAADNSNYGLCMTHCAADLRDTNYFKRNGTGIRVDYASFFWVEMGTTYIWNSTTGLQVSSNSTARGLSRLSYSGNVTNQTISADSYGN